MNTRMNPKARKFILECDHYLWLIIYPNVGEVLWCPYCQDERVVGNPAVKVARTVEDGWVSQPTGRGGFNGQCIWVENCEYKASDRNWYKLRDKMETHIMRDHTRSRFSPTIEIVTKPLSKDTKPPF